jgi:hypothetical protein
MCTVCCLLPLQERLEQQKKERANKGQEYNKDFKPQRSKVSSQADAESARKC